MSELERKIAERILREGPIPFSVFMEMALYDERLGYYRGEPFGKDGDFFTASQLQPVFGAYVRAVAEKLMPGFACFVDIGAGRCELSTSFGDGVYRSVEEGQQIPKSQNAILFSNELIDAMPVDVYEGDVMLKVERREERFVWWPHGPVEDVREVRNAVSKHLHEAYEAIEEGFYILIDYGYRKLERARFASGSLMSYRKHVASDEVLAEPGKRDITAHVDWDAVIDAATEAGWRVESFESLRASMLGLGPDVLEGLNSLGEMQFRTLLFSFGESFDVLILSKKKGPDFSGPSLVNK
ncbi:MAG: SAM-dependent methyltransferase [Acidobacteria bacterium]|nr:SAM-dependent methyltransferase [Acidobacteriota bacterium]